MIGGDKMELIKRKTTIGIAIGTFLLALLSVSPYGSAFRCTTDCIPPSESLYNSSIYAALEVPEPMPSEAVVTHEKPVIRDQKVSGDDEKVLRRTLVVLLLLGATEVQRATVSN